MEWKYCWKSWQVTDRKYKRRKQTSSWETYKVWRETSNRSNHDEWLEALWRSWSTSQWIKRWYWLRRLINVFKK